MNKYSPRSPPSELTKRSKGNDSLMRANHFKTALGRGRRESITAGKWLHRINFHLPFDEILLKLGTKYEITEYQHEKKNTVRPLTGWHQDVTLYCAMNFSGGRSDINSCFQRRVFQMFCNEIPTKKKKSLAHYSSKTLIHFLSRTTSTPMKIFQPPQQF